MNIEATGEVSEGVFALGLPQVPVFAVRCGDSWALIEGGVSAVAGLVLRQLYELVSDLTRVKYWLITHSHYDHCGLLRYLLPWLPAVQVFGSEGVHHAFESDRGQNVVDALNAEVSATWWREHGPSPLMVERRMPPRDVDVRVLHEGDALTLSDDRNFEVIATPGHAHCQLAYYDRRRSACFVSDALGEQLERDKFCPLVFDDAHAYSVTLRKLESLALETTFLAHHVVTTRVDSRIARDAAREAFLRLRSRVAAGPGTPERLDELALELTSEFGARSHDFVSETLHVKSMRRMLSLLARYRELVS